MPRAARLLAATLLAVIAAAFVHAQSGAPAADSSAQKQKPAVIRTTSRLVQVNVVVTDKSGAPVAGLSASDFQLLDNGQPQEVSVFVASETTPAAPLPTEQRTGRFFSNRRFEVKPGAVAPNLYAVLFDGLNSKVSDQDYARQQVLAFLRSIQPGDLVAIFVLGNGLRVVHDFSSDLASLKRTVERLSVDVNMRYDTAGPDLSGSEVALFGEFASSAQSRINTQFTQNRVMFTLNALEALANHLAGSGGRKNLLWVSAGFPLDTGLQKPEENFARLDVQRSFSAESQRVMRAMNRANVVIYPIDCRGLVAVVDNSASLPTDAGGPLTQISRAGSGRPGGSRGGGSPPAGGGNSILTTGAPTGANTLPSSPFDTYNVGQTQQAMREIADQTGGRAFYNTNDLSGAIRSAIDDSKVAYTLGYYPNHGKWNGAYHDIKVALKRRDLQARFRRGYLASPDAPPITEQEGVPQLQAAVAQPLTAAAVGISAELAPLESDEAQLQLRLRIHTSEVQLQNAGGNFAGAVDLFVDVVDAKLASTWHSGQRFTLNLKPETYQRMLRDGLLFRMNVPKAEPGCTLRIALSDASTGAAGTLRISYADILASLVAPAK